jgi:hypothetical protein
MRIDLYRGIVKAGCSALCILSVTGCGGGGDDAQVASGSNQPSAATQAVAAEVDSRMAGTSAAAPTGGMPPDGTESDGVGGHDTGGHDTGGMGETDLGLDMVGTSGTGDMSDVNMNQANMYAGDGTQGNSQYGQQQNGQGQNQGPTRPADVAQWTSAQILAAVEEKDNRVLRAIQAKAEVSQDEPEFAQLMTQVLQKSSGEQVGSAAGGVGAFGIPGLGSLFGGGGQAPRNSGKTSSRPKIKSGSAPPGGAFYQPRIDRIIPSPALGIDSLEMMIGEAVLAYAPQAAAGTRAAAERIQGSASGHDAAPGGMAETGVAPIANPANSAVGAPGGHDAMPTGPGTMNADTMNAGAMNAGAMSSGSLGAPVGANPRTSNNQYNNGGYGGGQPALTGNLQDEELVRTVVQALILNNSAPSWQTLKSIISGDVVTPIPQPLSTEIVLAEVFSAEFPNATAASEMLTAATQAVVADPLENQTMMRFLAALAQRPTDHFLMLGKPLPPAGMAPPPGAQPPGAQPNGMNQGEMSSMMQPGQSVPGQPSSAMMSGGPPGSEYAGDDMAGAENYNSGPPGGRPQGPPPGSLPPVRVSPAGMAIVANVLWNKESVAAVTSQLIAADNPAVVVDTLALASTMPSDEVRHATFTLFEKSHEGGAMALTSSGLFRDVARDPGLLAVLKALPRVRAKKPTNPNINGAVVQADPTESWVAATQDVVMSLRDRLRDVSTDPNLAFTGVQPVRLHVGAVAESSIMIRVPGKAASELGESAPSDTTMYYSVCRVSPQRESEMQKVADHYEKRSKGIKREDRSNGILWYDGVRVDPDGTRVTMDVVIQQVGFKPQQNGGFNGGGGYDQEGSGFDGGGGGGPANAATQFTIEVIVVVARDPKTAPGVSTASIK